MRVKIAVVLAVLLAGRLAAQRSYYVEIGIDHYPEDPCCTEGLKFASKDAALFDKYFAGARRPDMDSVRLPNDAEQWRVSMELRRVLLPPGGAGPKDTVYLFLSARGTARPGDRDGFLHTSRSVQSKLESSSLPVSDLKDWIAASKAAQVVIFADVSRSPAGVFQDNSINAVLSRELGSITKPVVAGVLGSQPRKLSLEEPSLQFPGEASRGYGVFGYYLAKNGKLALPELVKSLNQQLFQQTSGRQVPQPIGRMDVSLVRAPFAPPVPVHGWWLTTLASLALFPRLSAFQIAAPCFSREEMASPAQLSARLRSTGASERCRLEAAAALADQGQLYVTRYGMTDLLPDDPRKVTLENFRFAALSLGAAEGLLPATGWEDFARRLCARRRFCEGRSQLQRAPLEEAIQLDGRFLPEAENALGVYYLESATEKDYRQAITHFRNAKRMSPWWMYPRHNLALVHIELGDYAAAVAEYREALRVAPESGDLHLAPPYMPYNLGLVYQKTNRRAEAELQYRRSLDLYDAAIRILARRGQEWEQTLPNDAAIARQRQGVYRRNQGEVLNTLGTLLEARGSVPNPKRENAAIAQYRAAIAAKPDLCPALYNLGFVLQRQTERVRAGAVSPEGLERQLAAVRSCSTFHPAWIEIGRTRLLQKNYPGAESAYRSALQAAGGNSAAASGLATALSGAGSTGEAIAVLRGFVANRPSVALQEQLGDLYQSKPGTEAKARACSAYDVAWQGAKKMEYAGNIRRLREKVRQCGTGPQ